MAGSARSPGNVKVGNLRNTLTRWQALDYIMQIGVDRSAQDALHAIVVVPGACAAWRRLAVLRAGGYSSATLAEDCDLALHLQELGYQVAQSDRAEAYTEAPESFRELSHQRFRWTYGNAQALWKHRSMILNPRYGWLGMFSLPSCVVSILMPLVFLPFVYVMAAMTIIQRDTSLLLTYAAVFLSVQLVQAVAGVALTRERPVHLLIVPIYRLIAEPLRAYLLYKSALTVLRGTRIALAQGEASGQHRHARAGEFGGPPMTVAGRIVAAVLACVVVGTLPGCGRDQPSAPTFSVEGYLVPWDQRSQVAAGAGVLTEVSPVWFQPTDTGEVVFASEEARASAASADLDDVSVTPSISNFRSGHWDGEMIGHIVGDPTRRVRACTGHCGTRSVARVVRDRHRLRVDADVESRCLQRLRRRTCGGPGREYRRGCP